MSIIRYKSGRILFNLPQISIKKSEFFGIIGLLALACGLLASSWRKWLDPQIDYGRELYIPWRMLEGGKLFKDVDDLYGPLSRFIQLGLFKVFGPGMMVLAWANIVIYFIIFGLLYYLFRKAWGVQAALLCQFIFVGVFSFSQLVITSNYNFVTPYAQQVTHGFLVSLVLLAILPQWIESMSARRSFFVGLCLGLSLVLKPEFILSNTLVIGLAFYFRIKKYGIPKYTELLTGALGVLLPTAILFIYFVSYLSFSKAFIAASFAWMNGLLIWKDEYTAHLLNNFSGMDQPWVHLIVHIRATLWALAIFIVLALVSIGISKSIKVYRSKTLGADSLIGDAVPFLLIGIISAVVIWIALAKITWANIGTCLLGLVLIYSSFKALITLKDGTVIKLTQKGLLRGLISVLALTLMTRMLLNGRIYQYGFIQALIATMLVVAVLIEEAPLWLSKFKAVYKNDLPCYKVGVTILCLIGVCVLMTQSQRLYQAKTLAVGDGSDLFYTFTPQVNAQGALLNNFSKVLITRPKKETLLVLPEGIMLNYLSRMRSPASELTLYTNSYAENEIIKKLEKNRPDCIVLLSRDLTEYGVIRYGSRGQSGEHIISWMKSNYKAFITQGQDPLYSKGEGGILYVIDKSNVK